MATRRKFFAAMTLPGVEASRLSPLMAGALLVLALAAIGAAAFAAYAILGRGSDAEQSSVQDWKPPTLASVELPPPTSPSADVQTLSRPIFSKNRRPSNKAPATPTAPTPAVTTAAPSDLQLAAIVKHGGVASAFIISTATPDGEWKKVGDTVDAWTVDAISDSDLTLKNGDQAVKLQLFPDPPQ